ncbi:MAG TPA: mechanosensitive ion channel family protein [Devosiaceae bacterium]|nr:mechanosensitive ion channel family protein [Devosiaceae bacterium]
MTETLAAVPAWVVGLLEVVVSLVLAIMVHRLAYSGLGRLVQSRDALWQALLVRLKNPTRLTLIVLALVLATDIAPLTSDQSTFVQHILQLGIIALIADVTWTALNIWMGLYIRRFKADAADSFLARKHVTQTHILRRVAGFLVWLTAISAGLMTFDGVRQYGISLLASAGAAGVIAGLALQPVLKNLFAGIQIAITQPIKIGDSLIVEGDFGTVEDITSTYVVVRTWDLRRLVLPLSYFIEQPFQNWTRESMNLLGYVMMYLDYQAPIEALRAKAKEVVEASPLWDKKVFAVQITDFRERTMEVRVLVSAANGGHLFDLRCDIREKLIGYLKAEHPLALPRTRTAVEGFASPAAEHSNGLDGAAFPGERVAGID